MTEAGISWWMALGIGASFSLIFVAVLVAAMKWAETIDRYFGEGRDD